MSSASAEAATPTTTGNLAVNLPSTAADRDRRDLPSANTAASTYTDETSLVTYDNLGAAHTLNIYFSKTGVDAKGNYTWQVDVFDAAGASASGGFPYSAELASGTLTFSQTNGALPTGSPLTLHRSQRPEHEPRSQPVDAARGELRRQRRDRQRQCAELADRRHDQLQRNARLRIQQRRVEPRLRNPVGDSRQRGQSDLGQRQRFPGQPELRHGPRRRRRHRRARPDRLFVARRSRPSTSPPS